MKDKLWERYENEAVKEKFILFIIVCAFMRERERLREKDTLMGSCHAVIPFPWTSTLLESWTWTQHGFKLTGGSDLAVGPVAYSTAVQFATDSTTKVG